MGHDDSVHAVGGWPGYDPELAAPLRVTVAVTVNGKVRAQMEVDAGTPAVELERRALEVPRITALLDGRPPRNVIAVVDRIVNVVV
jgi:leucyl-tRNA synthetase